MAADKTLVQGAAMAAPKFVNAAGAFENKFKSTLGEITEATNKANEKRSELISSLDFIQFDENGNTIPMSESQRAIAESIRAGYIDQINSGDPFAPNKAKIIGDAKIEVSKVSALANVHKQVVADLQSAKSELSGANDLEAIEKLNQIKDAKLEKDPKTGEYKYNVGGVLKSAQELAAYPDDIIEVPAVPMKNVNAVFAQATEKYKTVDPNNPGKYAFDVIHAKPFLEGKVQEQLNDPAYGNDFRYHTLSSGDSMYIKSNNPIAKLYAGKTKKQIDEIALTALQTGGQLNPNAPQEVKDKMVREFLNNEVKNAYVEGFMQMQPNATLQPKPEKQTTYKRTPLEEEMAKTRPFVDDVTNFVKRINPADKKEAKYKGDEKVKKIINKINSLNPESPTNFLTRGEAFKRYVELENERLKSLTEDEREKELKGKSWVSSEEMKQNFLKAIGENEKNKGLNQIFEITEFEEGPAEFKAAPLNTRDSKSILNFMLGRIDMSDKAENAFKSELVAKQFK